MRGWMVGLVVVVLAAAAYAAYCSGRTPTPPTPTTTPRSMTRPPAPSDLVPIELEIKVHPKATPVLTEADATRIAAEGSALLQNTEFAGDVACAVKLVSMRLESFRAGEGIVDSPDAFDALFVQRANNLALERSSGNRWQVRVVQEITWCSRFVPAGGCADLSRKRIAVARRPPAVEGILWAHEVGHTQGLEHRTDSNVALMWRSILPDHNLLSQDECNAFKK